MEDTSRHEYFMRQAVVEAEKAVEKDEVPVGAVIVYENRIIARAHNQREMLNDPTAHAEMIAITQAADYLQNWRLTGTTLYVTLEPCAMCAGALVQARIDTLVYGTVDKKAGACTSVMNLVQEPRFNHRLKVIPNILADESKYLLQNFFRKLPYEVIIKSGRLRRLHELKIIPPLMGGTKGGCVTFLSPHLASPSRGRNNSLKFLNV